MVSENQIENLLRSHIDKVDAMAKDLNQLIGKVDIVFPTIATNGFVRSEVKEQLAKHRTECWRDGTYTKSARLASDTIGHRHSLIPQSRKGLMVLYSLIASMGGALVLVIKWLITKGN